MLMVSLPAISQVEEMPSTCMKEPLAKVGSNIVWKDGQVLLFRAGMTIDADGAPTAYHPDDAGLDRLENAGKPGNWWAVVTDNGDPDGTPVLQDEREPAPGFFISTTALQDRNRDWADPRRYVDATSVPYIVLPGQVPNARLGDFAAVIRPSTGALAYAIFADIGPPAHLGEGSIALAERLGVNPDARHGGTSEPLLYLLFSGSGDGRPHNAGEITREAEIRFRQWGGVARARACFESSAEGFATGRP